MTTDKQKKFHKVLCLKCKKERFVTYRQWQNIEKGTSKLCSRCAKIGKRLSEETKAKLKECFKGIPRSVEVRKKISKGLMGKYKGIKSRLWRGGKMAEYPEYERIRKSTEYNLWRKVIFERDDFTCQKCQINGGRLNAHHINNFADFPELRLSLDNGMVLCIKCHYEFHKQYGKHNNTKKQLEEFLNKRA